MSRLDIIIKEQLGAGYSADRSDVPQPYRVQTPTPVNGVQPTTPAGAVMPTGSPVSNIPSPE